jgi:hypothetical protein
MSLINSDNSHTTQIGFSSTENPSLVNPNVLPEPQSNVQAAASFIPCSQKGGKINRKKINKISRKYKMSRTRKSSIKRRIRKLSKSFMRKSKGKKHTRRNHKSRRYMKGGYAQYQNNLPMTNTYALGGKLAASESALANPPLVDKLSNCTNCIDNYNHNSLNANGYRTGSGFPSKGSYYTF